jgi:hypothetical protein
LRASNEELLKQCRQEFFRSSGPGGQHRNKVETGVRLHHGPSGVTAQSADLRLRGENLKRATRRLRERIAYEVRAPLNLDSPEPPEEFIARRGGGRSLSVSSRSADFPVIAATVLDALAAAKGSYAKAADALGVATSQLIGFLKSDRELWRTSEIAKGKG